MQEGKYHILFYPVVNFLNFMRYVTVLLNAHNVLIYRVITLFNSYVI